MAKSKTAIAPRRAPSVPKKKYEMALRAASSAKRRARDVADERLGVLIGVGTGFAIGKLESKGKRLPTVGGVEPTALIGGVLAFGPALFGVKGRIANAAAEVGSASLGIAAYKFGLGNPLIAGEGDDFE